MKMYKVEYIEKKPDYDGCYIYEYKELVNYIEPSKDELISLIETMYATLTNCMQHPRAYPMSSEVMDVCRNWLKKIDESNITSEMIRWYQNPRFNKIPEDEVERRKAFEQKYAIKILE